MQPVISWVVKGICGRRVKRTGRGYMVKNALVPHHPLNNIEITNYFIYEPRFNGVFSKKQFSQNKRWVICYKFRW